MVNYNIYMYIQFFVDNGPIIKTFPYIFAPNAVDINHVINFYCALRWIFGTIPPTLNTFKLSFSLGKTKKTYHSDIVSIQQNLIQFCHSSSFWCAFTIINTMDKTLLLIYTCSYITKRYANYIAIR